MIHFLLVAIEIAIASILKLFTVGSHLLASCHQFALFLLQLYKLLFQVVSLLL
jgi:hypothetical protein